ncbi:unnamed protein product [Adineta steineri]|uniref:Uncharacterized protein n=1 Tax=Adineta steineri TaxID=433720 RepID=A0A815KXW8_9BILA|nr:unnamed protein product [Adineta steineri]CAF1401607.1 unnamed protein product [Adineta steineri]
MDDLMNDLEAGITYNPSRSSNKKMKKRKQLDALLKFRLSKSNRLSNEVGHTSEDELFLPEKKNTLNKSQSSRYRRWYNYTRHILSFCFVCIFMIVCVGLAYANIELKNEVQNLSLRVTEIEKRFSSYEINRMISLIEDIKTRFNVIESWNVSYIYDRLQKLQVDFHQMKGNAHAAESSMNNEEVDVSSKLDKIEEKSTHMSELADELEKLSRDADIVTEKTKTFDRNFLTHLLEQEGRENLQQDRNQLAKNILSLNESLSTNTNKWHEELKSLRDELASLNQTVKIQELIVHFQELNNIVHNSTEKTSIILTTLQSNLDQLRTQIDACKCSKEPLRLKPSVVDSNQLQQSIVTKPNTINTSSSSSSTTTSTVDASTELNQSEKTNSNNTIDIAQIINPPPTQTG